MSNLTYYKIRHRVTGKYSKGSSYSNAEGDNSYWSAKGGKTWDTLGKLRAHITMHLPSGSYRKGTDMSNWEVIEYNVVVKEVKGISDIIDPKKFMDILKNGY
jgi:hypothetical protein